MVPPMLRLASHRGSRTPPGGPINNPESVSLSSLYLYHHSCHAANLFQRLTCPACVKMSRLEGPPPELIPKRDREEGGTPLLYGEPLFGVPSAADPYSLPTNARHPATPYGIICLKEGHSPSGTGVSKWAPQGGGVEGLRLLCTVGVEDGIADG